MIVRRAASVTDRAGRPPAYSVHPIGHALPICGVLIPHLLLRADEQRLEGLIRGDAERLEDGRDEFLIRSNG